MNPELQNLLHRWRENSLTTEEMRALTAELNQPAAREALRRDWFLEAALPQSLAAIVRGEDACVGRELVHPLRSG